MFNKNIFQIWLERDRKLPFYVRRRSWSKHSKFKVTKIYASYYNKETNIPERQISEKHPYGTAEGYYYNDDKKGEYQKLNCSGCYQWEEENDEEDIDKK